MRDLLPMLSKFEALTLKERRKFIGNGKKDADSEEVKGYDCTSIALQAVAMSASKCARPILFGMRRSR